MIKNAKITSVSLGFEDHGILTCWLNLDYGGSGQGFGGYGFSHTPKHKPIGAADFADFIIGILRTLEVETWEKLPGKVIRADAEHSKVSRIGHALKDQWFDPQEVVGKRNGKNRTLKMMTAHDTAPAARERLDTSGLRLRYRLRRWRQQLWCRLARGTRLWVCEKCGTAHRHPRLRPRCEGG